MADTFGPNLRNPTVSKQNQDGVPNKSKFDQLMEKLRRRERQLSSWTETSRTLKLLLAERKVADESTRLYIGHHLETLQKAFKVHGFRGVTERLERIAVSLGLRVTRPASVDHLHRTCVLEAECFRIDVVLDAGGTVKDVRVKHDGDHREVRYTEIIKLINEGKFEEVKNHIAGILAIYNIGTDRKQKSRAFFTLQSLESDLLNLSKFQSCITNVQNLILKSPLGLVLHRVAGRPMKLVYFVPPYELVDENAKTISTMTADGIRENSLGHSVTVNMEPSTPHKLQNMALISTKVQDGKSLPSFMSFTKTNSCVLPAVFTLQLSPPIPMAHSLIKTIQTEIGLELSEVEEISYKPLTQLLIKDALKDTPYESNALSVVLPDQKHSYSLNCCAECDDYMGAIVTKIPFVHPTNVAKVIQLLRQQSLYNTIIGSCVRKHASLGGDGMLTFEVTAISMQAVNVTFEHPYTDAVTTVGFDLSDMTGGRCTLSTTGPISDPSCEHTATNVFQRCLSLPVTMRYVARTLSENMEESIKPRSPSPPPNDIRFVPKKLHTTLNLSKLGQERRAAFADSRLLREDHVIGFKSTRSAGPYSNLNSHSGPFVPPSATIVNSGPTPVAARKNQVNMPIPTPTSLMNATQAMPQAKAQPVTPTKVPQNSQPIISPELVDDLQSGAVNPSNVPRETIEAIKKDKIKKNPMLASLLDQERESPEPVPNNQSMLSQLLGDAPDPTGVTLPHKATIQQQPKQTKRKRRSLGDSQGSVSGLHNQVGVSPKRLASEEDILTNMGKVYPTLAPAEHHTSQNAMPNNMDSLLNNQAHQQQVGNFHTQTRVGGGNSLYFVSSSHQSNFTTSNPLVSSNIAPNSSSSALPVQSLHNAPSFSQESHVSRLASSVDNFIKQESLEHSVANSSSCASVVSTVINTSSTVSPPRTVPTSLHALTSHTSTSNSHVHTSAHNTQRNCTSQQQQVTSQQHMSVQFHNSSLVHPSQANNANVNQAFQKPKMSELVSLLNEDGDIKQEPKFSDSKTFMEQSFQVKQEPKFLGSYSTVDDSIFKTDSRLNNDSVFRANLDSASSNKTKSFEIENDPFEFTESFLGPQPSVDGAFDTANSSNLGMEFSDQKPVITAGFAQPASKETGSDIVKQESVPSKNSEDHPKKERKKTIRESSLQGEEKQDKLSNFSMKININTKTNTIVRASPHRSESPTDSKLGIKKVPSTPDIASQESSRDSDVFITHTSSSKGSELFNNSHKSSKKSESSKKKKKASKHDNEVKHERKRKREEEARLKAEQVKKQKVYDFELNESEHLPPIKPTKIKIRTCDGKIQIQTSTSSTSKILSMSPLPMKASDRSESPNLGSSSAKSHKSDKSKHRHSSSKHGKMKSAQSQSQSGKVDKEKDTKLNKTPVVRIKPLNEDPNSSNSKPATATPQSAPVQLNSAHDQLSKTLKAQVTNSNMTKTSKLLPNCSVDAARSKSLSHLHEASKQATSVHNAGIIGDTFIVLDTDKNTVAMLGSTSDKGVTTIATSLNSASSKSTHVSSEVVKSKHNSSGSVSDKNRVSGNQSKHRGTVLNSSSDNTQTKVRLSASESADKTKNSASTNAVNADDKRTVYNSTDKSKSGQSVDGKSKTVQNSVIDSKSRQNSTADSKSKSLIQNSAIDSKSKTASQTTESSRAKTPTQSSSTENKIRSASSSSTNKVQSNSNESVKSRSLSASVNSIPNNSDSSRSKVNSTSDKDSGTKSKHEKSVNSVSSLDSQRHKQQNRQRKRSLDQVINKLTKAPGDHDPTTQAEKYDQIRKTILGQGGADKQTAPSFKINKISKKSDAVVASPVATASSLPAKPQNSINSVVKPLIPKKSPSILSSKRGPIKDSNKPSFHIPKINKVDNKMNLNKNDPRKNSNSSDSKSSSVNAQSGSSDNKRPMSNAHQRPNQSGAVNHFQRQNSRDSQKIDAISEKLLGRHFLDAVKGSGEGEGSKGGTSQKYSSHQQNHDRARSKSPVIKGNKHVTDKGVTSQSSKVNSSQPQQSNRPKTPVEMKNSQFVGVKTSSRDPRKAGAEPSEAKASPVANAVPALAEKSPPPPVTVSTSTPASPPQMFYNPAQALKHANTDKKPINVPLNKTPAAAVVNESPLSPIRHDTPPASPLMTSDLANNKENVAKSIPLNDNINKVLSPASDPQSPDEVPPPPTANEFVKVIPKTNVNAKPLSPRSDISSPECSLIIDYPNSPESNAKTDLAPKCIPLERSQSRSPNSPPAQNNCETPDEDINSSKIVNKLKTIESVKSPSLVIGDSPCSIDDGLMHEALGL